MTLDRRAVAGGFLLVTLALHRWIFIPPLTGTLLGAAGAAIPYAVLLLASFATRRRSAVWGGALALVLGEAISLAISPLLRGSLADRSVDASRMMGWMMIPMLLTPPASAVFVLPIGMVAGAWIGRGLGEAEDLAPAVSVAAARVGNAAALAGTLIVLATSLLGGGFTPGTLAFAAWALLPYGLLVLSGRAVPDAWAVGGASAAALAAEIGIRAATFLFPRGSTAAIGLLFSPAYISAVFVPAGGAAGWALGRAWRVCGPLGRTATGLFSVGALGLIVLGLARPELFPTAVVRRHAALVRIGAPRVIKGADSFERVTVSDRSGWYLAGDFDSGPGDVIAVVDHRGAAFLDPVDFRERGRVAFGGEPGRLWNWYSTLARLEGRLVVVQTGGGYQSTEVRELDGTLAWSYHPDPHLPPTALKPADLDADGQLEFYASDRHAMVRLDGNGREVWRQPTRLATLIALTPRSEESAAWVVGSDYPYPVKVWDETGRVLAEIPNPKDAGVVGAVDWPGKRALLFGGTTARGVGLNANTLFELPLGEFTLTEAITVRLSPGARAHLGLVAAAPRDLERWRLLVLSPERETVYDEILARPVRLLKARRADGGETLLSSGDGLRVLRPLRK